MPRRIPFHSKDFLASVVVFLVALPLCMGIAIASNVPPALGLITGIIGGLIIGPLAGSPLQVSGPAAGLAVLIYELVTDQRYGLEVLGVAVLTAGLLQVAAGAAGIGRWFRAVSPAVVQGMLAGIGALIFASQFHVMVDDKPPGGGLENLTTIPSSFIKGVWPIDGNPHHTAALIGVLTIGSLLLWNAFKPSKLKAIPGPLIAVVVAAIAAGVAELETTIAHVDVPSNLFDALNAPALSSFQLLWTDWSFTGQVVALALIASAETLLCATAVDRMHTGPRTNYDRELLAQGVGNSVAGVFGALPATGVIVRSSANVEAGARTRASAILHGVWLFGLVAFFPAVLALIPTSALAAILVYTGYRLLNPPQWKRLWAAGRSEFAIFFATVVMIVVTDLLTGVLTGVALSIAKFVYTFSQLTIRHRERDGEDHLYLKGAATFMRLPALAEALEAIGPGRTVYLHIGRLAYVDHACHELLQSWQHGHEQGGGVVHTEWDTLADRTRRDMIFAPRGDDGGDTTRDSHSEGDGRADGSGEGGKPGSNPDRPGA